MQFREMLDVVLAPFGQIVSMVCTRCSSFACERNQNCQRYQITSVVIDVILRGSFSYAIICRNRMLNHKVQRLHNVIFAESKPNCGKIV